MLVFAPTPNMGQAWPARGRFAASGVFVGVLPLLPAAPIIAGFFVTSHSASAGPPVAGYSPTAQTSRLTSQPPSEQGAIVAQVLRRSVIRAAPGGRRLAVLRTRTEVGPPEDLPFVTPTPGWVGGGIP